MQLVLNLEQAREQRDQGISQAISHADQVEPGWSERAYKMFEDWLRGWVTGYKFMMEDFRMVSKIRGLEDPPSERAYGSLAVKALKKGLIERAGFSQVKNVKAHRANASVWRKV